MDAVRILDTAATVPLSMLLLPLGAGVTQPSNPAVWVGCDDGTVRIFAVPFDQMTAALMSGQPQTQATTPTVRRTPISRREEEAAARGREAEGERRRREDDIIIRQILATSSFCIWSLCLFDDFTLSSVILHPLFLFLAYPKTLSSLLTSSLLITPPSLLFLATVCEARSVFGSRTARRSRFVGFRSVERIRLRRRWKTHLTH